MYGKVFLDIKHKYKLFYKDRHHQYLTQILGMCYVKYLYHIKNLFWIKYLWRWKYFETFICVLHQKNWNEPSTIMVTSEMISLTWWSNAFYCDLSNFSLTWYCSHNLDKTAPQSRASLVCVPESYCCRLNCIHIHRRCTSAYSKCVWACGYQEKISCTLRIHIGHIGNSFP